MAKIMALYIFVTILAQWGIDDAYRRTTTP